MLRTIQKTKGQKKGIYCFETETLGAAVVSSSRDKTGDVHLGAAAATGTAAAAQQYFQWLRRHRRPAMKTDSAAGRPKH